MTSVSWIWFLAAAVSILPILTIYFIASNKIVEVITKGAIK